MKYVLYLKNENTEIVDAEVKEIDDTDIDVIKKKLGKSINGSTLVKIKPISDFNFNEINPEVNLGDRILIINMNGESYETTGGITFGETIGKVIRKIVQPKFRPTDPGYGYYVEWYDDIGNVISKLPIFPESDSWLYDKKFYKSQGTFLNEGMIENIDDLIKWGEFLQLFTKKELEKVGDMFELERRSGFSNMALEGGRFLLSGPKYIEAFLNLKSFEKNFDEDDKKLHKIIISRSQEVREIFIRNAMKYLKNKDEDNELENDQIKNTMVRLARTAKEYYLRNADKFIKKEIL